MTIRRALAGDIQTVVSLTEAAYAPYNAILDAPPIPVTEDYAPRIANGEVWLLESGGEPAGVLTLERHANRCRESEKRQIFKHYHMISILV